MAQLNIDDDFWTDPRLEILADVLKSRDLANGMMLRAMRIAQRYWAPKLGAPRQLIPKDIWDASGLDQLCVVGLAERRDGGVYLRGSFDRFDWLVDARENGRRGGKKSAAARAEKLGTAQPFPEAKPNPPLSHPQATLRGFPNLIDTVIDTVTATATKIQNSNTLSEAPAAPTNVAKKMRTSKPVEVSKTSLVFQAYAKSYLQVHKDVAKPNARNYALCKQLITDLGFDDALRVAEFFPFHRNSWYLQNRHELKILISKSQPILTDLNTMSTISRQSADRDEVAQQNEQVIKRFMEKEGIL